MMEPVTRPGNIWCLDRHRLLCGNATVQQSFEQLMQGEMAAMVFTDPPYNVGYESLLLSIDRGLNRERSRRYNKIANDNLGSSYFDFLCTALKLIHSYCNGAIYMCSAAAQIDTAVTAFRASGGHFSTIIIWAKNVFSINRSDYRYQYEMIIYGWPEGKKRYWCGGRNQSNLWHIKRPNKNDLHPTMKPVELVERAICNSSRPGDIVLDPFAGSGSTLVAAERTGRIAYLMEIDPHYCDVIVRRWEEYTGKKAIRHEADTA